MKRFSIPFAAFAAALALCLTFAPAGKVQASDKFAAALANADGGSTYIAGGLAPLVRYTIQCTAAACYATSTSNQTAANCSSHDYVLPPRAAGMSTSTGSLQYTDAGINSGALVLAATATTTVQLGARQIFEREFDMGSDSVVLAKSLTSGDPGCVVSQVTLNPNSLR